MSLDALFARRTLGIRLGLETVFEAWRALGAPAAEVPAVHVVGTNGKGSTSAMIEHALRRHGLRTGLYTSPHLHRVAERVRIDGVPDDDRALETAVDRVLAAEGTLALPRPLSFFELLTLGAWLRFADRGVGVIVAEAGLGGRCDATRICHAHAVAIASIDLDHQAMLGSTLAAIAAEKVAVARPGVPVISVAQPDAVMAVLRAHTEAIGAPLEVVAPLDGTPRGLVGRHQRDNAALALAAARVLRPSVDPADLDGVVWPGRFESRDHRCGRVIFDVAHNPAGIAALVATLDTEAPGAAILVGCAADKDTAAIVASITASGRRWAWVDTSALGITGVRPTGAPELLSGAVEVLAWVDAVADGGGTVCVCGSHALVAAARAHVLGLAQAQPGERTTTVGDRPA